MLLKRMRWLGLVFAAWFSTASATDEMALMHWVDALNQRWLLSQEIAAYQYRHALDPPVMLQPLRAPLLAYAKGIGLPAALAQNFLVAERAVDQQLQQRWLRQWQQQGFDFDSEDFLDAPALCQKQERLERDMLRDLLSLQPTLDNPHEKARFTTLLSEAVMVPQLTAQDREHFLNALFARS